MGFFSNLFAPNSVALNEPPPFQTVTVEKKKRRYGGDGKENIDVNNQKSTRKSKGGWFNNNKKKKKGKKRKGNRSHKSVETPVSTSAPKLSIFLQQNSEPDNDSLNHTIDTGSLTASLTSYSKASDNQPLHAEYVRAITPTRARTPLNLTRPPSAKGVDPPPLNKAFPIDDVTEDEGDSSDSNSDVKEKEVKQPLQQLTHSKNNSSSADSSSDTEKSDTTAETTAEDLDLSPKSNERKSTSTTSMSVKINEIPSLTHKSPPSYHNEGAELSDPAASLDSTDDSYSDSSGEVAIEVLNKLTAELTAELDTFAKVEPVEESNADSVSLDERLTEVEPLLSAEASLSESLSLADSEDAVDFYQLDEEDSANADLRLLPDLEESSTNIADLLQEPTMQIEFDAKTIEQDFFTAVNSEHTIDDGTFGVDSANADLGWKAGSDDEEGQDGHLSPTAHFEFDIDFLKKDGPVKDEVKTTEVEVNPVNDNTIAVEGKNTVDSNQVKKTFDQIINEVEETIAKSQKLHGANNDNSNWIPNGLLNTVRDDTSLKSQSSSFSFTSDDFKEEDTEVLNTSSMKDGLGISMITEENEEEDASQCPLDAAMERGKAKSQVEESHEEEESRENAIEELRQSLTTALDPSTSTKASLPKEDVTKLEESSTPFTETALKATVSSSPPTHSKPLLSAMRNTPLYSSTPILSTNNRPKSALLCKSTPRPGLKKSVSWKEDFDVVTYLPAQAQDLQKARDLVATYARIMSALNSKRPTSSDSSKSSLTNNEDEKSMSSSSDADLSEASSSSTSSLESLLSALSNASSASNESMKIAIQQITEETEKLVSKSFENIEEAKNEAKTEMLENKWPSVEEPVNNSSSSLESLLSALSQASSTSSGSVKMVVQKLKEEAEKRVIFSSQKLEQEKERFLRGEDSSISSSSFSSAGTSKASSTGTSESVKKLMKELNNERSKQAQVFTSTLDMFTLLHNKQSSEQARVQILGNNWIDDMEGLESGSSSTLSSLLSASPCSSQSTNDSSESVKYMMEMLQRESERHKQRRNKIRSVREFVDSVCFISNSDIISQSYSSMSNSGM